MEKRRLIKQYKNGNKVWGVTVRCMKCNGSGVIPQFYHVSSGTCFDCNGTGWVEEKEYEYTPENLAKREAEEAKRREKWEAERAEREAEEAKRIAEWKAQEEELERIRRGHYYGEVGQNVEIEVTYTGCFSISTMYGYLTFYKFDTDDGAHLIWKTSGDLGGNDLQILEGDNIKIKATIKAHNEYNGIEQTELLRVKVISGGVKRRECTREELIEGEQNQRKMSEEEYNLWLRGLYMKEGK